MSIETTSTTLFYSALRRLLHPLVKALITRGMIFPAAVELLRELYVDVAINNFLVEGKEQTVSRISLMTGVTRREVHRLLEQRKEGESEQLKLSLGERALMVWRGDETYLDDQGEPLPLPLTAPEDQPSLKRLVASVSKDVRARAVLDEWLRLGIVEMSGYVVRLRRSGFISEEGYEEKIYFFGRNLRDHISAGVHKLEGNEPAFFDSVVYYDCLSPPSLEVLRRFALDHGAKLLHRVDQKARKLADEDAADDGDFSGRMTLGVYYFHEEEKG